MVTQNRRFGSLVGRPAHNILAFGWFIPTPTKNQFQWILFRSAAIGHDRLWCVDSDERHSSDPAAYAGVVYFSTWTPAANRCRRSHIDHLMIVMRV